MYPVAAARGRSFQSSGVASINPATLSNLVLWCQKGVGQTDAGSGECSQWADQSGTAHHLKQDSAIQPNIQGDGSLLFNGVNDQLKCDPFTLNQPFTVYLLAKQITWATGDRIIDGNTNDSTLIWQTGVSPAIVIFATNSVASNTNWPLDTYAVVCGVFNGASSSLRVNNTTKTTGNIGANNAGGFSLGARGGGGNGANIQVQEVVINNAADNDATQTGVIAYLAAVGGLSI